MTDYLISHQGVITAACFVGAMLFISIWEGVSQRRLLTVPMGIRWFGNIAITIFDIALVRMILPLIGVGFAIHVAEQGWGLFPLLDFPFFITAALALIIFDFSRYLFHFSLHRVPLLWRIHFVHHTDIDFDFTTGLRFHPAEAIVTAIYNIAVISLLGAPVIVVLIYEMVSNVMGVFAHANVNIPLRADRWLRNVIVTPDVHRIHHSAAPGETNSNYAGITPWWDRLFGTYIAQPLNGHENMTVGLPEFRDAKHLRLKWMLIQPFLVKTS